MPTSELSVVVDWDLDFENLSLQDDVLANDKNNSADLTRCGINWSTVGW